MVPGRRHPSEWTEAERLGLRIATQLQCLFQAVPSAATLVSLQRADAAFDGEQTLTQRRVDCVEAIAYHAVKCQTPEWQADAALRRHGLRAVAHNFAVMDEGLCKVFPLPVVTQDDRGETVERYPNRLNKLAALIGQYDADAGRKPPGVKRGKGAERIMAEIIVTMAKGDALNFGALVKRKRQDGEADEDVVDAIRGDLADDVSQLFSRENQA
jgi:hypothetical protein